MENLVYIIVITFSIIGWYICIKEIIYQILYKNIDIDKDIKCQLIVKNKEENIEVILRKILYLQSKEIGFKTIEVIDEGSNDETYQILEKMHEEHPNIKIKKML